MIRTDSLPDCTNRTRLEKYGARLRNPHVSRGAPLNDSPTTSRNQPQPSPSHDNNTSRLLIALAGPPGSGKTTIAREVVRRLNITSDKTGLAAPRAVVVSMDGYHYLRATLDTWPNAAEAHLRRGAAWTFDAHGVEALVRRLRTPSSAVIYAPGFDHATKDPVADAVAIPADVRLVLLEGNWLLYDAEPWREILGAGLVDEGWFVDVDRATAVKRVAERHLRSGIESSWEAALARARGNDVVNGDEVGSRLVEPTVRVVSVDEDRNDK